MRESRDCGTWPLPALTREGQRIFWDRQAPSYGGADMTLDNAGELTLVRHIAKDYVSQGFPCEDVVTLGGAIGCRDPKVVLDELAANNRAPRQIYFNDLSSHMVDAALASSLSGYKDRVIAHAGAIHEIASRIPSRPRRVIIGVYGGFALITPKPFEHYALAGLDEYVRNRATLGDRFILEPTRFLGGKWGGMGERSVVMAGDKSAYQSGVASVKHYMDLPDWSAIRVIGQHRGLPGFFLSHWFAERGITALVRSCFGDKRTVKMWRCAKGFVFSIDPIARPEGIVTILNNVVGNVLPDEQPNTLKAIHALSS